MSNKLARKKHPVQSHQHQFTQKIHHGPIPTPEDMVMYDQLLPGLANRIVTMAEEQSHHRMEHERKSLNSDITVKRDIAAERKRGQFMAFVIALLLPSLGTTLILHNYPIIGTIFGGVGLFPVVWAFIPKKQ